MAGLYFHVPFCKKACSYCDFHFSTGLKAKGLLVRSMRKELEARWNELDQPLETIYFGGGTPSLLEASELSTLLEGLALKTDAEFTFEVNPDDVTQERLAMWKAQGVNRLSIGIQSFREADLQAMGRAHDRDEAIRSLELIKDAGFKSWTLDLIYGLPDLSLGDWRKNIEQALAFGPPHISSYCLTIEEGTALHHKVEKGEVSVPDEDQQAEQFELLIELLQAQGYVHYEISNFAKPGHMALHNTNYWKRVPFVGIGPSAHSFNVNERRWNIRNNALYIKRLEDGQAFHDGEKIDVRTAANEMIMTGLRTMWGVDLHALPLSFGKEQQSTIITEIERGMIEQNQERLVLTPQGRLLADWIASQLFFV